MKDSGTFRQRLYERYASTQAERGGAAGDGPRAPYLDRLIRRFFPPDRGARIVDLGCGEGVLLRRLAHLGYTNARGVDTSPEQVALAGARGSAVACGDLFAALRDTADASLDVVVAFDVLEHYGRSEALRLADEAHRVLRPGGRFVVHVPNGGALLGAPAFFGDLTHETCFTAGSMRQLLAVAGFAEVRLAEDAPTVHGARSALRWILWQALRQGARFVTAVETGSAGEGIHSQNFLAVGIKTAASGAADRLSA